ncbi:MAG: hypothetical protein ACREHC_07710 [Candidatus Levyibacteriota bacterium]
MQDTIRTTIRIRRGLLDQARVLALSKGVSLQEVINETLTVGYKHITDLHTTKQAMKQIDSFRNGMLGKDISVTKLRKLSSSDQK